MIKINPSACIGCGKCVKDCVGDNIFLENRKAHIIGACIHCGHCVAICPKKAVSIPDYDMADVEEYNPKTFALPSPNLLNAIKFRRSIRQYRPMPIETEKLEQVIKAGRYAATAKNSQACRFFVIQERLDEWKQLIWEGIGQKLSLPQQKIPDSFRPFREIFDSRQKDPSQDFLFRNAPAVLYVATDRPVDAGLAAQSMELAALSLGLGCLYNGYLVRAAAANEEALKWLGADQRPLAACMLMGYPQVTYLRTAPRKKADVIWL